MNKSYLFKNLALLGVVTAGSVAFAPKAEAFVSSTCYGVGTMYTFTTFGCASEGTLSAQYNYLATGRHTGMGAITGLAGANDGIIEQMRKLNDNMAKLNEGGRQDLPNNDLASRAATVDLEQRRAIEPYTRPLTSAACREATFSKGSGAGGGGGATAKARRTKQAEDIKEILTPKLEDEYIADLVSGSAVNNCTQQDIDNKMPNCAAVGKTPGRNLDPSSLFESVDKNKSYKHEKGDLSYDAMMNYIDIVKPFPAPRISENAKGTVDANRYLILQRRYNSRVATVSAIFNHIAAESASLDPQSYMVQQIWNKNEMKDVFKEIYGNDVKYPLTPSEREILHLNVHRQFSADVVENDTSSQPVEYYAQRQIELLKIQNQLLLKQIEKQDLTNIALASILSQNVDPLDRKALESAAASANQGRGGSSGGK